MVTESRVAAGNEAAPHGGGSRHDGVAMRIGVAGVGRIGVLHATTLTGLPGVEVVVTDADPEVARRVADELGASTAPDAAGLLAIGVDGFVITTATPGHAPLLREALAAGVPTFCEKPVAATLTEAMELARLAAASEVPVQVGFQRRFDPGYQRARAAVASGELGTIHAVRAITHDHPPPRPPTSRRAGASSATVRSTTSTSPGTSPAVRSCRSTRRVRTRERRSSRRTATWTPPRPSSPSMTAPS